RRTLRQRCWSDRCSVRSPNSRRLRWSLSSRLRAIARRRPRVNAVAASPTPRPGLKSSRWQGPDTLLTAHLLESPKLQAPPAPEAGLLFVGPLGTPPGGPALA